LIKFTHFLVFQRKLRSAKRLSLFQPGLNGPER
jgi:hypothetical protein